MKVEDEAKISALIAEILSRAVEEVQANRLIAATNIVIESLDDLLYARAFTVAAQMLNAIDVSLFPPTVLIGALTVTRHASKEIGTARSEFLLRVRGALLHQWGQSPELVDATIKRLQ